MRRLRAPTLSFLAVSAFAAPLAAAVEGVVTSAHGAPVEGARVEVRGVPDGETAFTDLAGSFLLADTEPPVTLHIVHPRFHELEIEVAAGDGGRVEAVLAVKQEIFEEVVVSASRGESGSAPASIAVTLIRPQDAVAPPATLTELVATVPGVAENGQGGIFQTYSVRGVSRQRVLTLVAGMRIVGERRAGVSASFLDPTLMGTVDVVRGPASTYYGSGALGGVVQLFPEAYDGLSLETGYQSAGDETHLRLGWGEAGWSLGLARRQAGKAEAPDGTRLNSGFEQVSATAARRWSRGERSYELLAIGSRGEDIGKSSTEFPERTTVYPEEEHLLVRFAASGADRWRLEAFVHPNDLKTQVDEGTSLSEVRNEAFDLGVNWQRRIALGDRFVSRLGVEYFGRRSVTAEERQSAGALPGASVQRTLDGATEDEAGVYGAVERRFGKADLIAGGRFAWQRQGNSGAPSRDDTAWTGFVGLQVPLGGGFELAGNLGTGLRFPSLSERFFSGTTGRGQVVGNQAVDPERSVSAELGLRWFGSHLYVAAHVFHNEIDDYIERVEVSPGLLTFVNLTAGTLEGAELDGFLEVARGVRITFGGHAIDGSDESGRPLADVATDRAFLGTRWQRGAWTAEGRWERRASKGDVGSGEKAIPAADLVSASVSVELSERLALSLTGRNLLDESYFNSADRRVPLSPGRSLGLGLSLTR